MKHKRAVITTLVIVLVAVVYVQYPAYSQLMLLKKTQWRYQNQIITFIKGSRNSLDTVCADTKAHPNQTYYSDGQSIELTEGRADPIPITRENTEPALWDSLANLMLDQNSSPLRMDQIDYLQDENAWAFTLHLPNQSSNLVIILFQRTDGVQEPLRWSSLLSDEIVYWIDDDWYISYGIRRKPCCLFSFF